MSRSDSASPEIGHLNLALAALDGQRQVLGDAVVDAAQAPIRERLRALQQKPVEQQRKQVTVLFADISGFTAAVEAQDAEDVAEAVNALWALVDRAILAHGGAIDKHIGDAVMALWGTSSTQEDDPERAVLAALNIQQQIQETGLKLLAGQRFAMRIAIHTGPVFLGMVGTTGEYTALGDTVNTASRLQMAAPVGGVLISHETLQLVRGLFDVVPVDTIDARGKSAPLQAYQVLGAKPRTFRQVRRGLEGIETCMVGRDAELGFLQEAYRRSAQEKCAQLVTVIGDAGIGKSRLLYEFERWLEQLSEEIWYFKGRASPQMQRLPYALLRDLLVFRFQLQENETAAVAYQKIEQGLGSVLGMDESGLMRAHFIAQLLGFDFSASPHLQGVLDGRQLRDRALRYLGEFFRAHAEQGPAIIFLEDVHWADDSSLAAIEGLAGAVGDLPVLIVALARPSLFERHTQWANHLPAQIRLMLEPLTKDDSRSLVNTILQRAGEVPPVLQEMIVGRAEGNPFYVEEFIKMLIEDGVVVKGLERWQIDPERLVAMRVPSTLAEILQARLDSLPEQERKMLQQASVVGRVFWDDTLRYMEEGEETRAENGPGQAPDSLNQALEALARRELIFARRSSAFSGAQEFIFKHALLHEVTYESVLKRERRQYHARVAEWLIHRGGERTDEYTGLIADHLELAGEFNQAVIYLQKAGDHAAAQFDNRQAIEYLSRSLRLLPEGQYIQVRIGALLARERVYDLLGMREQQTADLQALQTLIDGLEGKPAEAARLQAILARRWSNYYEVTSDYPRAAAAAQLAVEKAQLAGDVASQADGYQLWGRAIWRNADLPQALQRLQQGLELASQAGLQQTQATCLRTIGAIYFHQGDYSQVSEIYQQALSLYRAIGDRRGEGSALNNLGDIARQQGDYEFARQCFEESIRFSREMGERWSENVALGNMALVSLRLGDIEASLADAKRTLQLAQEIGYRSTEGTGHELVGNALMALGRYEEAQQHYQQALSLRREIGVLLQTNETLAALARLALTQGDLPSAIAYVEEIWRYLQTNNLDGLDEPFLVYLICCQVLRAAEDERFRPLLERAYQLLQNQALRISDPEMRKSFLHNVVAHSELAKLWEASQP